jgi:hypothetical protein
MHRRPSAILAMLDRDTTTRIEKAKEEARKPLRDRFPRIVGTLICIGLLLAWGAVSYFLWRHL